jgi:hypothetical protein
MRDTARSIATRRREREREKERVTLIVHAVTARSASGIDERREVSERETLFRRDPHRLSAEENASAVTMPQPIR